MRNLHFTEELGLETLNRLQLCVFQREENGQHEPGLLLNEGSLGIIDKKGKQVEKVWDYRIRPEFAVEIGNLMKQYDKERYDFFHGDLPELIGSHEEKGRADIIRSHFVDAWDELRGRKGNLRASNVIRFCTFVEYHYLFESAEAAWWNDNVELLEDWESLEQFLKVNHSEKYPEEW